MKKIKKKAWFQWAIAFILVIMNFNLYPLICLNGSGRGYNEVGDSLIINATNTTENYIIEGAGFYLNAKSNFEKLLRLIELRDNCDLEYKEMNVLVDNTIANMQNVIGTYDALIQWAENLPYNENVQVKLKKFNYKSFLITNELNRIVFDRVSGFLKQGDITGCFKNTLEKMKYILELLQVVKEATALNRIPELAILWRLNETFCETSLFGSYVARVFSTI